MARTSPQAPALPVERSTPQKSKRTEDPNGSYWSSLNQTLETDEYELMLPKEVHGLRRSSIHRKI